MSRQIETNYFNPDLLLAKEAFRNTVCDITGTEGNGVIHGANLNYTSAEEIQNSLSEIGMRSFLDISDTNMLQDDSIPSSSNLTAKYIEKGMVVVDLVRGKNSAIAISNQTTWKASLGLEFIFERISGASQITQVVHSIQVDTEQSDKPAQATTSLREVVHNSEGRARRKLDVLSSPISTETLVLFSGLASELRQRNKR